MLETDEYEMRFRDYPDEPSDAPWWLALVFVCIGATWFFATGGIA
ncbi:MAG TPA: hypothetical protein VFM32_03965 [Spongiibacteraceae bacterium]|nr:hypothetical protein [Spongiibacteraceae bacterium]